MTITSLLNKIFKANQTPNNTVNWSGVNGLKTIQEDLVEEIRQRTFLTIPTIGDLANQGFSNAVLCYVQNGAFYRWSATGTPNGITIFAAVDGGVWIQETIATPGAGITSLNGLNQAVQTFAVGTSGIDFNISSVLSTHTFNLPTSSNVNRGALSSTDWTMFNDKQNAITLTTLGTSGPSTLVGSTLNIPNYNTSSSVKSYGAWQHNVTQTAAVNNTGYGVRFDVGDIIGQGVDIQPDSLGNNTLIKMNNAGTYNIQFSFQFQNIDNAEQDVTIWLRKNGQNTAADVAGSGGFISVPKTHGGGGGTPGHSIAAWNYFVEANAGDYFQLVWSTSSAANVTMQYYAAGSPPPSSASAILTVNQVN
jgi:hypothetical protein